MTPLHISLPGHHFSTDYLSNYRPSGGMHHSMLRSSIFSRHGHTQSFPPSILSSKGKNSLGTGSLGMFPVGICPVFDLSSASYSGSQQPPSPRKAGELSTSPLLSATVVTGWCRLNANTLVDNMQRWCRNSSQPAVDCEVPFFGIPLLSLVCERHPDLSNKCHRSEVHNPRLLCKHKQYVK